jgi:N utilization substance protein A
VQNRFQTVDDYKSFVEWIIEELKRIGCDTARSVLDLTATELERRTDLEKETIEELRNVLRAEFDKD